MEIDLSCGVLGRFESREGTLGANASFTNLLLSEELIGTPALTLDMVPNFRNESQWCTYNVEKSHRRVRALLVPFHCRVAAQRVGRGGGVAQSWTSDQGADTTHGLQDTSCHHVCSSSPDF